MGSGSSSVLDSYDSCFEVAPVETAEQLAAAFRLRYQVYCVENQFENSEGSPTGLEIDAYDQHSLHSLLLHRTSREPLGTVRLILPGACPGAKAAGLPVREICPREFIGKKSPLPLERTAEISRFAISKRICCRTVGRNAGAPFAASHGITGRIPDLSLGLMQAVIGMAARAEITHLCAVMEPSLLRILARLGIHVTPLGPMVVWHGQRQPCYSDIDRLLARIWAERRDVWQVLTRDGMLWPLNTDIAAWHREPFVQRLTSIS